MLLGLTTQGTKNEEAVEAAALSHQVWGLPVGSLSSVNTRVNKQAPCTSPTPPQSSQKEIYRPAVKLIRDCPHTAPMSHMLDAFIYKAPCCAMIALFFSFASGNRKNIGYRCVWIFCTVLGQFSCAPLTIYVPSPFKAFYILPNLYIKLLEAHSTLKTISFGKVRFSTGRSSHLSFPASADDHCSHAFNLRSALHRLRHLFCRSASNLGAGSSVTA